LHENPLAAIGSVHGAISIDSGGGLFACGPAARIDRLTIEACLVEVNGQVVDSATGAAVMGHPAQALATAANELGRRGLAIERGMTQAVAVPAGCPLAVHFTSLGSVFVR
jgi:2-oxo-3-hexenedioate decarboxylase